MITINDQEFAVEDLTDEQKHLVNQVLRCRNQVSDLLAQVQILQTAEASFSDSLEASVDS